MKKLILALAILGFVACNNEAETTEPAVDTTATETPAVDTAAPVVDTTAADTTAPAAAPAQ